jgi:very-short-patch-repair endonuclease
MLHTTIWRQFPSWEGPGVGNKKIMTKKRKIIPYNPKLKPLAKKLRKDMTFSEVLLWNELKQNKMHGYDFDRQRPIDEYIVDFYCKDLMLAIEVDGESHYSEEAYFKDIERQKRLESLGVSFIRFEDLEVKREIANVLRSIEQWILEWEMHNKPTPGPSQEGNVPAKYNMKEK